MTVFQFSFICGRYELYLFFCNWFLFLFLPTCLWMSSVLCRALSVSAVAGALPVQQLPLPSCQQHPGHCLCFLCSLGHPCAVHHTSCAGIPSFHFVPSCLAPVLGASSTWSRLESLQVSLTLEECLSLQSAHLQQVIPGSPQGDLLHLLQRKCSLAPASLVIFLSLSWAYLHFSVASTVALLILMNSSCASRSYCWSGSLKEQDCLAQDITNDWHQSHTLTGSCSILLRGLLLSCC